MVDFGKLLSSYAYAIVGIKHTLPKKALEIGNETANQLLYTDKVVRKVEWYHYLSETLG